ncbi:MAG TPA: Ig-like domain-containing protein [Baekduia sp.]
MPRSLLLALLVVLCLGAGAQVAAADPSITVDAPAPNALVRPTFAMHGTGAADTLLTVTDDDDREIGRTTVGECGCWSLTTTAALTDGPHTLTLSQDVDGTPQTATLAVTVDPDALALTSPTGDDPVLAAGLHFTGLGAPGATIAVYQDPDDTTPIVTGTVDPQGAFDVAVDVAPGVGYFIVTQTPVGGSESDPIAVSLVLLLPPPTITIDGPATVAAGDAIALFGDGASAGAHVVLYDDGDGITDVTADPDGDWAATIPALDGDNAITVAQVDATIPAISDQSAPVHATGVGAVAVTDPAAGSQVAKTLRLAGTALPGAAIAVSEGVAVLGTATADSGTGAWSLTTTVPLAYGDHTLAVRQTVAGVTGADTPLAVTVVPDAPTATLPDHSTGGLRVTGTADPSATIDVFVDGASTPLGSGSADSTGAFAFTLAQPAGTYSVRLSQHVGASLSGPLSPAVTVTVLPEPAPLPGPVEVPTAPPATPTATPPALPPHTAPAPLSVPFTITKKAIKKTTVTLLLRIPGAGRLTVTATMKVGGKRVTYATAKASLRAATAAQRLVLRPSRKAKAGLKKLAKAKITITATFTPTHGKAIHKTATVSVRGTRHR